MADTHLGMVDRDNRSKLKVVRDGGMRVRERERVKGSETTESEREKEIEWNGES